MKVAARTRGNTVQKNSCGLTRLGERKREKHLYCVLDRHFHSMRRIKTGKIRIKYIRVCLPFPSLSVLEGKKKKMYFDEHGPQKKNGENERSIMRSAVGW